MREGYPECKGCRGCRGGAAAVEVPFGGELGVPAKAAGEEVEDGNAGNDGTTWLAD